MDFIPKILYHDKDILLCRKPHWIASSWGQEASFLDSIKRVDSDFPSSCWTGFSISEIPDQVRNDTWQHQISTFGEEWEYGLLNRLDNVTAGLLYFARSYEAKEQYIHLQEQWLITKTYYAKIYGAPRAQFGWITTPIYHHRDDVSRMTTDPERWRWKPQEVVTYWEVVEGRHPEELEGFHYNRWDVSTSLRYAQHDALLKIQITSGCRHQIRCHLASIGYPIVWDRLYMTTWLKKQYPEFDEKRIELVSAGLEIKNFRL